MVEKIIKFIKIHKIALILALILGISPSLMVKDYSKEFNEVAPKVNELEYKIPALKNNTELKSIQEEVDKLQNENNILNKDVQDKQKELDNLKDKKEEQARIEQEESKKAEENSKNKTVENSNSTSDNNSKNTNKSSGDPSNLANSSGDSTPKTAGSGEIVYWTSGGKSYHKRSNCTTLKRSKKIYSGTQAESGKSDPCNVCCR